MVQIALTLDLVILAIRPLTDQIFRWPKRLTSAPKVELQLRLETDYVEWFPGRLRYVLDNLISNSLKYHDPAKDENWVRLELRRVPEGFEFRISDNGLGLSAAEREQAFDLSHRAGPERSPGLGVGLTVVKPLVEQSGGSLEVASGTGQGSCFVLYLPRFELDDFLL